MLAIQSSLHQSYSPTHTQTSRQPDTKCLAQGHKVLRVCTSWNSCFFKEKALIDSNMIYFTKFDKNVTEAFSQTYFPSPQLEKRNFGFVADGAKMNMQTWPI